MSFEAINYAIERAPTRTATEQAVLLVLANRTAKDTGAADFLSLKRIAREARTSLGTVCRVLADLERRGVVARCKGGGRARTTYRINLSCVEISRGETARTTRVELSHLARPALSLEESSSPIAADDPVIDPVAQPESKPGAAADAPRVSVFFDAFMARYPNRQFAPRAVSAAWSELKPSPELAAQIVADLDKRLARGWPRPGTELRYVKSAVNWLRDRCWEMPLPDPAGEPRATGPSLEGRLVTGECPECYGAIRGVFRNGEPVYPPVCRSCELRAKAS